MAACPPPKYATEYIYVYIIFLGSYFPLHSFNYSLSLIYQLCCLSQVLFTFGCIFLCITILMTWQLNCTKKIPAWRRHWQTLKSYGYKTEQQIKLYIYYTTKTVQNLTQHRWKWWMYVFQGSVLIVLNNDWLLYMSATKFGTHILLNLRMCSVRVNGNQYSKQ